MIGQVSPFDVTTRYAPAPSSLLGGIDSTRPDSSVFGASSLAGPALTQTISALQINAQVAQLLQGVGSGLENNQMLQLMIGLLILISLLQGSQQPQTASDALNELAAQSGGRAAAVGGTATSISIEHTRITWNAENAAAVQTTSQEAQPQGQRVDLAA